MPLFEIDLTHEYNWLINHLYEHTDYAWYNITHSQNKVSYHVLETVMLVSDEEVSMLRVLANMEYIKIKDSPISNTFKQVTVQHRFFDVDPVKSLEFLKVFTDRELGKRHKNFNKLGDKPRVISLETLDDFDRNEIQKRWSNMPEAYIRHMNESSRVCPLA